MNPRDLFDRLAAGYEYDPMYGELCNERDQLKAENRRLQEVAADGEMHAREILAENARLRELLLDVWNDAMQFDGFWDYVNDDGEIYNEDELPHYYDRMRELGVEVDE